ncbi:hypothetical protein U1Q18_000044 [Sarracenia purpurea var. burkii]
MGVLPREASDSENAFVLGVRRLGVVGLGPRHLRRGDNFKACYHVIGGYTLVFFGKLCYCKNDRACLAVTPLLYTREINIHCGAEVFKVGDSFSFTFSSWWATGSKCGLGAMYGARKSGGEEKE